MSDEDHEKMQYAWLNFSDESREILFNSWWETGEETFRKGGNECQELILTMMESVYHGGTQEARQAFMDYFMPKISERDEEAVTRRLAGMFASGLGLKK